MKKTLPRFLSLSVVGVLALAVTACAAGEGVPGVPGVGVTGAAPSIDAPTITTTVDPPAPSSTTPVPTESSEDPFPTESSDDPFPTESSDDPFPTESSEAPVPTPTGSERPYSPTDKWNADKAVCSSARDAMLYRDPSLPAEKAYESYLTRAKQLKALEAKATIAEVKTAISALANFNQKMGTAMKERDSKGMLDLMKEMTSATGDYRKSSALISACKGGYIPGTY
ncbi:hypothetical protein [Galactobacter valiniphilus]|uniref:hypothetical protein n=1 Tax=Galactobacter valiniphilus TaxID=2676122 RepID=UPI0037369E3C